MLATCSRLRLLLTCVLSPGTVSYCAPELLKEGKLTKAADVLLLRHDHVGDVLGHSALPRHEQLPGGASDQLAAAALVGRLGLALAAFALLRGSGQ